MKYKRAQTPRSPETCQTFHSIQKRPFRPNYCLKIKEISRINCMQEDIFSGRRHLDRKEEIYLIRKVRRLDKAGKMNPNSPLSVTSNNIFDIISQNHIGIVVSICSRVMKTKKYLTSELGDQNELLRDMIQIGMIALEECVRWRFDLTRGFKLTTYATHRIRHDVKRYIEDLGTTIRKPVHVHEAGSTIAKATGRFYAMCGRSPTTEELIKESGMKSTKLSNAISNGRQKFLFKKENVDGFEEDLLALAPSAIDGPEQDTATSFDYGKVKAAFSHLKPMEVEVMKLRFGLDRRGELTLKEIGDKYGFSRERIRQLERDALKKLRARLEVAPRKRIQKRSDIMPEAAPAEPPISIPEGPAAVTAPGSKTEVISLQQFMPSSFTPKDFEQKKDVYTALIKETKSLTNREKLVLGFMYCLEGIEKKTPAQVARIMKVSRAEVLKIAKCAFEKLDYLVNPSLAPETQAGNG